MCWVFCHHNKECFHRLFLKIVWLAIKGNLSGNFCCSVVKSTGCYSREPEFNCQHHMAVPGPKEPPPSSGLSKYTSGAHTYVQTNNHTHKKMSDSFKTEESDEKPTIDTPCKH